MIFYKLYGSPQKRIKDNKKIIMCFLLVNTLFGYDFFS